MKHSIVLFVAVMAALVFAGVAQAEPLKLPPGSKVSAVCNGDGTATVKVTGVKVEFFEKYLYIKDKEVLTTGDLNQVPQDLSEGRRFNFGHSGSYYAGFSEEQSRASGHPGDFLGDNIDIYTPIKGEWKGKSSFIITCPALRALQKK